MNKKEKQELIEDLNLALDMLSHYEGGYSNQFIGADEFHEALSNEINLISNGKTDFSKIWIWFAPTCSWDDFVGKEGIEVGQRIFERVMDLDKN